MSEVRKTQPTKFKKSAWRKRAEERLEFVARTARRLEERAALARRS